MLNRFVTMAQSYGKADSRTERAVIMNLVKGDRFAHVSQPPVDGAGSSSVTRSTNGISTPSALALEKTSLAVAALAISRSPSKATH